MTRSPHEVSQRGTQEQTTDARTGDPVLHSPADSEQPPLTAFIGTSDVPLLTDEERALIDAGGKLRYAIVQPEVEGPNSV